MVVWYVLVYFIRKAGGGYIKQIKNESMPVVLCIFFFFFEKENKLRQKSFLFCQK